LDWNIGDWRFGRWDRGVGAGTRAFGAGIGTLGVATGTFFGVGTETGALGAGIGTGAWGTGAEGKNARALRAAEKFTSPDPVPKSNPTSKSTVKESSISIAVLASVESRRQGSISAFELQHHRRDSGNMRGLCRCPREATYFLYIKSPKNVVAPPSGPVNRGWLQISGLDRRLPILVNRIGVPPAEESDSIRGGETPNAGVSI
jgi:hypothetical protein